MITEVQIINVSLHSLQFQLFILNGLEIVSLCVEGQRKCRKLNMFQLCSVIFPTLITEGQIIKLLTQFTFTVKISAFHLERYRNGKTWCGWSKKIQKDYYFQLCSVIFPTMITEVQIINVSLHYV